MSILRPERPPAPKLPLSAFGPAWAEWITAAAEAAACPPDYVAAPLLVAASALIGHARWAQATPGWTEPPHLWLGVVGEPGSGKSPGSDVLMRDVLPEIERRMLADFPDRLLAWRVDTALSKAAKQRSRQELRDATAPGTPVIPAPVFVTSPPEPQIPRLRQHDVTIEKIAALLACAAPKGLLIVRDELAGWIASMNSFNSGARAFWIEAYGGRPYRVERKTDPEPIVVPRLAVAVYGGTQPDKLARLMREGDDGLLGRLLWVWPEPVPFRLGQQPPRVHWATRALDRLRELDLHGGDPPRPIFVPLDVEVRGSLERLGRNMQERQQAAEPLLRSALDKARGQALRLALVLEFLWWCGEESALPPPIRISPRAFVAAGVLITEYCLPMASRAYGNAGPITREHNAAILARWIMRARPETVHPRHLQREVRLPSLRTAPHIRGAAEILVAAGWLRPPVPNASFGPRARVCYSVNPRLWM